MDNLPDARSDGVCCDCGEKPAVTRDGRYCKTCLNRLIAHLTPMIGCNRGRFRTADHKENLHDEASAWQENAMRNLEGD